FGWASEERKPKDSFGHSGFGGLLKNEKELRFELSFFILNQQFRTSQIELFQLPYPGFNSLDMALDWTFGTASFENLIYKDGSDLGGIFGLLDFGFFSQCIETFLLRTTNSSRYIGMETLAYNTCC
ncbi:hypothetical protein RhiirA4_489232, partial [Rhizophagus irregularis]